MSRIVLEGPDNSGKTTLAKRLCWASGAKYYHPGGAPADEQSELHCLFEQQRLLSMPSPIVMDRVTCISQQIYNSNDRMDQLRAGHVRQFSAHRHIFVVYCRPSNEHLADVGNYTWRPEETEEHRQKIVTRAFEWVERYDRVMEKVPHLLYDFKDVAAAEVLVAALIGALTEEDFWMPWLNNVMKSGGRR